MFLQGNVEQIGGGFVIAMGSALGLGNDIVDAAEFAEVGSGDAHGFGGQFLLCSVAPHDGGAAFGRDDRID